MKLDEFLASVPTPETRARLDEIIQAIEPDFTFKACANDGALAYFDNWQEKRNLRVRVVLRKYPEDGINVKVTLAAYRGEEMPVSADFLAAPVAVIAAAVYAARLV